MKKLIAIAAFVLTTTFANAVPMVNWNTNAEVAYRMAQAVVYDDTPGSGDAAHVAAGNAVLAGSGVDFLTLAYYRDMFGSGFTSAANMGYIWYFTYAY